MRMQTDHKAVHGSPPHQDFELQFNGESGLLPAVLDSSFTSLRSLVRPATNLPPAIIIKTCDWGVFAIWSLA